jgi:hypothetical protein
LNSLSWKIRTKKCVINHRYLPKALIDQQVNTCIQYEWQEMSLPPQPTFLLSTTLQVEWTCGQQGSFTLKKLFLTLQIFWWHKPQYFAKICWPADEHPGSQEGRRTKNYRARTHTIGKLHRSWHQDRPTHFNVTLGKLGHILWRRGLNLTFTMERLDNLVSLTGMVYHHWNRLNMM